MMEFFFEARPRKSSDGGPGLPLGTPDRGAARSTRKPGGVSQSQVAEGES